MSHQGVHRFLPRSAVRFWRVAAHQLLNKTVDANQTGLAALILHPGEEGQLFQSAPEEERFATADLIRATTATGTPPELRDRMRRLKEAGYDEVVVQITPGHETMVEDWARVFETV